MNFWADSLFKKVQTTVRPDERPTAFVKDGPFKYVRHPMYLGMALILFGVALLLGSLSTFVIPAVFIVIIDLKFITPEERSMLEAFGEDYIVYTRRVGRWL